LRGASSVLALYDNCGKRGPNTKSSGCDATEHPKGKEMAKEPTDRQRQVFDFVCQAIRQEGLPPTVREIADHFGFSSPKAASDHLGALERKGYLSRRRGTSRNIEVAEKLDPRGIPVIRKIEPDTPVFTLGKVEESLNVTTLFEVDQNTVAVQVQDDSMEDEGIHEGDYVVVQAGEQVEDGSIGAVEVKDQILVRRIHFKDGGMRLVAEDADTGEMIVREGSEKVNIVGPVMGVVKILRQ